MPPAVRHVQDNGHPIDREIAFRRNKREHPSLQAQSQLWTSDLVPIPMTVPLPSPITVLVGVPISTTLPGTVRVTVGISVPEGVTQHLPGIRELVLNVKHAPTEGT
jgi:hypothetical protein